MGLLDKMLRNVVRQATDKVADAVSDKLADAVPDLFQTGRSSSVSEKENARASVNRPVDRRSFEEKLLSILEMEGSCELRRNIQPQELEQEFGQEIYAKGNKYCRPDVISYAVYRGTQRVLYIRLWQDYKDYAHMANRQIRSFCDSQGIKCLDFFDYLPNEAEYMSERIRGQLAA